MTRSAPLVVFSILLTCTNEKPVVSGHGSNSYNMQIDDHTISDQPQIKINLNGFIKAPKALVFDSILSATDKLVYLAIRSHKNEKSRNRVFPSIGRLCKLTHCSKSTITRSVKRLKEAGHINYVSGRRGRSNEYTFTSPIGSLMNTDGISHAQHIGSSTTPQSESVKKSNEGAPPYSKLFHGGDRVFLEVDESITILSSISGERLSYPGGDDASFRFGHLRGVEALNAARAQSKQRNAPRS